MEHTGPQVHSTREVAPVTGNGATPFSQQTVVLTKQAYIEIKWQAKYWRAQHERSLKREAALKAQVEALEATVRDLNQRLYGTKSEKSAGPDQAGSSKPTSARPRGQQPGSQGHGRSDRSALPVVAEVHDVSEAAQHCPHVARRSHRFQAPKSRTSSKCRSRPIFDASSVRATKRRAAARTSKAL